MPSDQIEETVVTQIKNYPPMFNNTAVPFFPELEIQSKSVQNKNLSEGGRTIIQKIRTDKWSVPVKMSVANDDWVRFFYNLSLADSCIFKQYSPILQGYSTRTVSIENFSFKMHKHSEDLTAVSGVWDISFTIEEF